eukprot:Skav221355  [mRNA]  locus=scaffold2286:13301:17892:+ [translate_table: standard]
MGLGGSTSHIFYLVSCPLRNECKLNLVCRAARFPSFWAQPPPRFLPKLLEIEGEESSVRLLYWGAVLLLSPPIMAATCETIRVCVAFAKAFYFRWSLESSSLYEKLREETSETLPSVRSDPEAPRTPTTPTADATHLFKGPGAVRNFYVGIVCYHVFCAGIVATAIANDWISVQNCGNFSWELWALWQQLCLWNLFLQNLVRCVMLETWMCLADSSISSEVHVASDTVVPTQVLWVTLLAAQCHLMFATPFLFAYVLSILPSQDISSFWTGSAILCIMLLILAGFALEFAEPGSLYTDGGLLSVLSVYVIVYSHIEVLLHEDCARDLRKTYRSILELPLKPTSFVKETEWEWMERQLSNQFVDFLSSSRLLIAWAEDLPQGVLGVLLVLCHGKGKGFGLAGFSAIVSTSKGLLIPSLQSVILEHRKSVVRTGLDALVESEEALSLLLAQLEETFLIRAEVADEVFRDLLVAPSDDVLKGLNVAEADLFEPVRELRQTWLLSAVSEHDRKFRRCLVSHFVQRGVSIQECLEAGYSSVECQYAGLSASRFKEAGCSLQECKQAGFSAKECKDGGFTVSEFQDVGFSATQCRIVGFLETECEGAGYSAKDWRQPFTAQSCKDAGMSVAYVKKAGFAAGFCKEAGFSASECRQGQFSVKDCKYAGFSAQECRDAGFTAAECRDAGFTAQECKDAGFTPMDFKHGGFSAIACRIVGFTADACQNSGFSDVEEVWTRTLTALDYKEAGCSANETKDIGFFPSQLKEAGFSAKDCCEASFSASDLRNAGYSAIQCKAVGFSEEEILTAGFSQQEVLDCGRAKPSARDFKDAGFSVVQCRDKGFDAWDCHDAGFVADDFKTAGFSAKNCKEVGISAVHCREAGFSAEECVVCRIVQFSYDACKNARFSDTEEAWNRALTAGDYKKAGCSANETRDAGFFPSQCKEAGFSAKDCYKAGFSADDFRSAGFSVIQCKAVGFQAHECDCAGYSIEAWDQSLSALDYKHSGFSANECLDLGFTAIDFKNNVFSANECEDAGFSAAQCHAAGFSLAECLVAGFSTRDCKDASFTGLDFFNAGFSA